MKILVSGSSGFLGSHIIDFLSPLGHQIFKLVRVRANLGKNEIAWDENRGVINPGLLEGMDAVIHLAGENIGNGLWTQSKKKRIRDSRVKGTQLLCQALSQLKNPPKVLLCASAVGIYGNRGDEILTESSPKGVGFLADVCSQWEAATQEASKKGIRVVNMRFGIVLSPDGGILKKLKVPFQLGLGGKIGSGQQYMSWVMIEDLFSAVNVLLNDDSFYGPVNITSPNPVTNEEFTKALGKSLHRPTWLTVPSFLLKFFLGEMADEMFLTSTRAVPEVLSRAGFQFAHKNLNLKQC